MIRGRIQLYLSEVAKLAVVCGGLFLAWLGVAGAVPGTGERVIGNGWRVLLAAAGLAVASAGRMLFRDTEDDDDLHTAPEGVDRRAAKGVDMEDGARAWVSPQLFFIPLFAAIFLELDVLPKLPNSNWSALAQHFSGALFIASFLGLTYENVLSGKREKQIKKLVKRQNSILDEVKSLAREQSEKVVALLMAQIAHIIQVEGAATPKMMLGLLRDLIGQVRQIPTLYEPARDAENEYTFAANLDYFDHLSKFRRQEFCLIVGQWIDDPKTPPNVKFFASDLIGKFQLSELSGRLRRKAQARLSSLSGIKDETERSWVLNYLWAASCCEEPKYESLREFLCSDADDWAQEWILFVPRQMPEPQFARVIDSYLRSNVKITPANLQNVITATRALRRGGVDVGKIIEASSQRFNTTELRSEISQAFSDVLGSRASSADRPERRPPSGVTLTPPGTTKPEQSS